MEAFADMDDDSLGLMGITANTIRVFAFLRRELEGVSIVVNTSKTMALPPKGHGRTAEEISLLESVDVRVADGEGVTVVGVPNGTDENVLLVERTREIVKEGGTDHVARCLANMPDKQAAALIVIESLGQSTGYLVRALDTELPLEACKRADNGAQWAYKKIFELLGVAEAQSFFQEGCPDERLTLEPHQQAQNTPFYGSGRVRVAFGGTEANVCLYWDNKVGILPEVLADLTGLLRDRVRRGLPESRIIA